MNKYILTTLLTVLFITNRSFGQRVKLLGTWVTRAGEKMIIDDPKENRYNFLTNSEGISKNLYLEIVKDTLCFYEEPNSKSGHGKTHYDLVIVSKTDSTLHLRPASTLSSQFFQNKSALHFSIQEYVTDKSIRFEKLIYHVRESWFVHNIDLQIEKNKSFYLYFESQRYGSGRSVEGSYTGVLTDSLYNDLIWCLQTCNLRQIRFEERDMKDAGEVILIVYFNGIRRYLKSNNHPHMTARLFHLLESVYYYADLKPSGGAPSGKQILEE